MSGSISNQTSLLSAASQAAKTNALAASSNASAASASSSSSALSSIADNFNSFLTMLTTQLQNQDPSSPTDADQFTSEIATFAGVQQQVNTNTNLNQLISITQSGQVVSGSSLVGQQASATSAQMPLQSGIGNIKFNTTNAEPVAIAVTDASGNLVRSVQETSSAGSNSWTWDGKDNSGNMMPDGAYGVAVETQDAAGNPLAVPFSVKGTITSVSKAASGDVMLNMGTESVDMNTVTGIGTSA